MLWMNQISDRIMNVISTEFACAGSFFFFQGLWGGISPPNNNKVCFLDVFHISLPTKAISPPKLHF